MPPKCYRIAVKAFGSWVVSSPTLEASGMFQRQLAAPQVPALIP
jgi:hypothetical protein